MDMNMNEYALRLWIFQFHRVFSRYPVYVLQIQDGSFIARLVYLIDS